MRSYKVRFVKYWTEYGEAEIEAEDEDEARDLARDMLMDGSDDIEWDSSMDPGDQDVESVEEL